MVWKDGLSIESGTWVHIWCCSRRIWLLFWVCWVGGLEADWVLVWWGNERFKYCKGHAKRLAASEWKEMSVFSWRLMTIWRRCWSSYCCWCWFCLVPCRWVLEGELNYCSELSLLLYADWSGRGDISANPLLLLVTGRRAFDVIDTVPSFLLSGDSTQSEWGHHLECGDRKIDCTVLMAPMAVAWH